MVATDKVFAGSILKFTIGTWFPLSSASYAVDLAERVAERTRGTCWRRPQEPELLHRAIASRLPADARIVATDSISQCLIVQRRGNLRMVELSGNRSMLWRCRLRIKALMWWPASLA